MMGEGFLLAFNWRGARRLTLWRLSPDHAHNKRPAGLARLTWRLGSSALQLLGVIWLATGLLTALFGLHSLV